MLKFDLNKSAQTLKLSLQKKGLVQPPVMELAFNLDVSGSFEDEHRGGLTTDLVTRLVPWGMVFDPDKKLDVFTFSNGASHVTLVGDITPNNYEDYVCKNIVDKVPGWNGGTDYSFVLERNLEHFGWVKVAMNGEVPAKSGGFLSRFLAKKAPVVETPVVQARRSLVVHVTDGEVFRDDKERTRKVLCESAARKDQVYFLFIGASNQPSLFDFIGELADEFPNVGLVIVKDLQGFVNKSDEELNDLLIGDELLEWLKK